MKRYTSSSLLQALAVLLVLLSAHLTWKKISATNQERSSSDEREYGDKVTLPGDQTLNREPSGTKLKIRTENWYERNIIDGGARLKEEHGDIEGLALLIDELHYALSNGLSTNDVDAWVYKESIVTLINDTQETQN